MSIQRFSRKNGGERERCAALDRFGDDRWCVAGSALANSNHPRQESEFDLALLADTLNLVQHRRAQKIDLACDHNSVRTDPMDRKLADDRFEFVQALQEPAPLKQPGRPLLRPDPAQR